MTAGREHVLERTQILPVPLEQAFAFFADPHNLEAITPGWLRFRIVSAPPAIVAGVRLRYRLRLFGVAIRWRTVIAEWDPPHAFVDVQERGPFRLWEHRHDLVARPDGSTEMRDRVRYRLPFGPLGRAGEAFVVRRWLDAIFDYRAAALASRFPA